jgi:hypothetical protein
MVVLEGLKLSRQLPKGVLVFTTGRRVEAASTDAVNMLWVPVESSFNVWVGELARG